MMGPTVLDIVALTGLRPHGEEVSAILGMSESACDILKYGNIYNNSLFHPKYLNVSKGEMAVTEEEHVSFLFAWLSNHLFCDSSVNMIKQCTKLAFALAAAPRSNGIKGNSQSAGNFGQNMKRKYKGDSIPSQPLGQQDEPIQQRNSHEVGEKIPTRTTSCKKMKTSPGEVPLPGTTSAIPSTLVVPTSCTPANEDRTKTDIQVYADATSISTSSSTSDKDGEDGTVSPSLAKTRNKTSDIIEPPDCVVKFDNLEDFFARVSGQIKRAQSLGFSAYQCSPNSTPSAEMLAKAKDDIERLLIMPSQDMLLPKNCSTLSAALSMYAATPDLSAERALALEKLKENLPHLSLTLRRAKKDQEEYYKEAAKKVLLVDELTKDQELYTNLKDSNDKLECTISKLKASLKEAKTKRKAIQEQKLSLANKCFEKSIALDQMEADFPVLEEMKKLADSDVARVEESL
ncbi:uncharacterized protein [Nicotiana sylvestris]|uniref:Aminotransferase-like plant mobile domain-containing protein n=3 Tax=Nicotiana TaxID=4085 RepID=A0A1S4AY39_TOBAC|nr:PREDICTED: uncharacterized protein LOC107802581 [Nicotiana tabacum]XP_016481597.1 PREDICTED: uncharacterized protein LOC107802581 [Nicotiana tabacum]